jgi:RNA polymerase sigma factor (sigma-70 family)
MTEVAETQQVDSFDRFFDAHYDDVVRTLILVAGDRDRADDAAQEAFAQAFRKWSTVSVMERPVGWVIVVGVNRLKRWIARGDRARPTDPANLGDPSELRGDGHRDLDRADRSDHAESVATADDLRVALDQLGRRQRATVVLRYLCDLSTDDVARALGCSPGTVKSALHQALANLRVTMQVDSTGEAASHDEERDDHAR